jgi:hypothetical protein
MQDYWQRQTADNPLFPDLLWSRPENKRLAGKLLIIGGNVQGFAAAAEAYNQASFAGVGTSRVILPDSLQKTVSRIFEAGEYVPSTPSGSLAKRALAEILDLSLWSDGVLIAGDLGRNSETAILLEQLLNKYSGQITITKDAVDYFTRSSKLITYRPNTTLVVSLAQLQKLAMSENYATAITFNMDLIRLAEALHDFTSIYPVNFIVKHLETIFVASNGRVSTTKLKEDMNIWRVKIAAGASVLWLQNPNKSFEALTSSLMY